MAEVRIESSEVMNLANNMQNWLNQMDFMRSQMIQRVRELENRWNDPQYHMFLDNLTGICNNLKNGTDSLEQMRRTLQIMAQAMEAQAQTFRQGMQNVRSGNGYGGSHW